MGHLFCFLIGIDLKNDFGNNFELLKSQDLSVIKDKISHINFDWTGFENTVI